MKKMLLNLASLFVITSGAMYLASNPAGAQEPIINSCKAANGAECTGVRCCATETQCFSVCPV